MPDGTEPPHKRTKFGHEQYKNSKTLSDVTIKYGDHGERTFYGHKIILCKYSRWFQAAFTGNFKESDAKEMTLHDDDPDALEVLLSYGYDQTGHGGQELFHELMSKRYGDSSNLTPKDLSKMFILSIRVAKVADKYDAPELRACAESYEEYMLGEWLRKVSNAQNPQEHGSEFQEMVEKAYEMTTDCKSPILDRILKAGRAMCDIWEGGGYYFKGLQPVFLSVSHEVPEFGRDVLHMMLVKNPLNGSFLTTAREVLCKKCKHRYASATLLPRRCPKC